MRYGIIVDSGCDLFVLPEGCSGGFARVPLKILVGEREFVDDAALDREEFARVLAVNKEKTGTAAPAPGEWAEAFRPYDCVVAFTLTGNLSGSYASACAAVHMLEEERPDVRVRVFDTLSAGPEITLQALKAAELFEAGKSFEEVCSEIEAYQKKTRLVFMLESIRNLANNGRVSKFEAKLLETLKIQLFGRASTEGTLEPLSKCRGKGKVWTKMLEHMEQEGYCGGPVSIAHNVNEAGVEQICANILAKYPQAQISVCTTGGLCSYYAEIGGLLLGYELG